MFLCSSSIGNENNNNNNNGIVIVLSVFGLSMLIRASVDALCRDGTDQISRERVQRGHLTRQGTRS